MFKQRVSFISIILCAIFILHKYSGQNGEAFASGEEINIGALRISSLYIRGTISDRPAAAYMTIHNMGPTSDRLSSGFSSSASIVEFHETNIDNGVVRMRRLPHIMLPANSATILKPGGLHIMVMGLKETLVAGSMFPLTLNFKHAGRIVVKLKVKTFSSENKGNESLLGHKNSHKKNFTKH